VKRTVLLRYELSLQTWYIRTLSEMASFAYAFSHMKIRTLEPSNLRLMDSTQVRTTLRIIIVQLLCLYESCEAIVTICLANFLAHATRRPPAFDRTIPSNRADTYSHQRHHSFHDRPRQYSFQLQGKGIFLADQISYAVETNPRTYLPISNPFSSEYPTYKL
jgi:hypothetical protein